jgi:hypothetical protein
MKNISYNILKEFCEVRNKENSFKGFDDPYTNRVHFILDKVFDLGLLEKFKLNVDVFENFNKLKYANIELSRNVNSDKSIMFIAHHDVNNVNSDNCQDNTASISNLLSLAYHFIANEPNKNLYIVFTDCEEFGGKGAKRLAERILDKHYGNVEYVVNLELTANGNNIWSDKYNFKNESKLADKIIALADVLEVKTPFNDSVILRGRGIDSVCIGTLTDEDMEQVVTKGYCKTWSLCHKYDDTFENANANDMNKFVKFLIKLI